MNIRTSLSIFAADSSVFLSPRRTGERRKQRASKVLFGRDRSWGNTSEWHGPYVVASLLTNDFGMTCKLHQSRSPILHGVGRWHHCWSVPSA
jgi:hypothetical protein